MERSGEFCKHSLIAVFCMTLAACGGGSTTSTPDDDKPDGNQDGAPGVVVNERTIGPGNICATGGVQIDTGIDTNLNRVLDASEISETHTVCNGENGNNGANGLSALISTVDEAPGSNCAAGGVKVSSGLDLNSNSSLDTQEVTDTVYVCHASDTSGGTDTPTSYKAFTYSTLVDTTAYPECPIYSAEARTTEYFELNQGANQQPYAVCTETQCNVGIEGGTWHLDASTGTSGCSTYRRESFTCFQGFTLNNTKDGCEAIDYCASDNLSACLTQERCEQELGFWWGNQCHINTQPLDQITVGYPSAGQAVTREANDNFSFTLDASDVRLSAVTLNGVSVKHLFTKQSDDSYQANFAAIRGFLIDGETNTLRITASNSSPDTVSFTADIASPNVIITNVSTETVLPEEDSNVSVQGVTRKTGLQAVTVGGTSLSVTASQFNGQISVPADLSTAATEADYTFTANFSGGVSSSTDMIAHGRPIASALALQINNGAYGPITDWLQDLFIAQLGEGDSSDLIDPITDRQLCEILLNADSAIPAACSVTFDIAADTVKPVVEVMAVNPASDDYGVDLQLKLTFDFVAANVAVSHADRTITTLMTWDSNDQTTDPIEVTLNLRARQDAAEGDSSGYVVGVYLQDVQGSDSLDFDFGNPAITNTSCVIGNCIDRSGAPISDAIVRAGWVTARPTVNDQAVDQFRAAVSETVNGDWDGTAPVLLSDFSLPAGASDPRPVSEDSDIEEVATVLPGDVNFANNGSGNNNGAFLAIGTGTHISNAADNASNLNTILGSRFNPTTSGFLSETGRLGSDGSLMVALSENSLNQELSLRYAAKEFDNLAAIPGTGAGGITELLNKAINDASPIPVGNVVKESQLNIAVSNAPYVQLETGNDVRLVMSDVKLNLQIDLGQGMITLVDSDLDLEAVLGFSVDADGQPDFNIESSDIGVSVLNVQSNDQVEINGVRLEGDLADQVESEVRKALLETLPEQIDDQLQSLGNLILPRQTPQLKNVGTDAPASLTNTLPKIFGFKVAENGISVEGSHLLLTGELKDVTEGTNDTLVSMCIYSSADDLDTCPSQQP